MLPNIHNDSQVLDLAQQGNREAIEKILNHYFNNHQIWIQVGWDDDRLILFCDALKLLPAQKVGQLFSKVLGQLKIAQAHTTIIYGRVKGEPEPCWQVQLEGGLSVPERNAIGERASESAPDLSLPSSSSAQKKQGQFLCCILDPDDHNHDSEKDQVLFPLESVYTILNIAANSILPVPYMAPCVLGLYRYRGQMLWILDLWQQLTARPLNERPSISADPHQFTTLILKDLNSGEFLGLSIPKLSEHIHHCSVKPAPDSLTLPSHRLPFICGYDPISNHPILNVNALIQDQQIQMHKA
ncbi:MAG: chemotaxis protein CheW [Cyanobacteria bacterium P01_F01_bin.150]